MNSRAARVLLQVLIVSLLVPGIAQAQAGGTLSGTVADPSGTAVPNAKVSVRNVATDQSTETQADAAGLYSVSNLAAAEYEVFVSAAGFAATTSKVTITAGAKQTLNLAFTAVSSNPVTPSLGDLGFTPDQTKGSAQDQARLDRRSHMLRTHQRLGLITTAPLLATLIVSNQAAGRHSTAAGRELHATLGGITAGMYLTTAGFAVFAPKIPGTTVRGPIRVHRALAWIHGPGMILTPVLGALAYGQVSRGEKIHGIAQAHSAVAAVTGVAYGLAILSVSIKF